MTQADFTKVLAKWSGLSLPNAKRAVAALPQALSFALIRSDRLSIRGLGVFTTRRRKAKRLRLPSSSVVVEIPPRRAMSFRVAKGLREAIR